MEMVIIILIVIVAIILMAIGATLDEINEKIKGPEARSREETNSPQSTLDSRSTFPTGNHFQ